MHSDKEQPYDTAASCEVLEADLPSAFAENLCSSGFICGFRIFFALAVGAVVLLVGSRFTIIACFYAAPNRDPIIDDFESNDCTIAGRRGIIGTARCTRLVPALAARVDPNCLEQESTWTHQIAITWSAAQAARAR